MDESLILWDVVEEHLDEAEFLFEMWESAIVAPDYTWKDVERSFGERLRAHLDAIAIAGEPAAKRLLLPGLADAGSERNRAAACALALLELPGEAWAWQVFQALVNAPAESELRAGIARALVVSGRATLDEELKAAVTDGGGAQVAELWSAVAERRVDAGPGVADAVRAEDVALRTAGVRAGVMRPAEELWGLVAPLLEAPEECVRMAAVETAMTWGLRAGWEQCVREARRGNADALAWVGMLGGEEEVELLKEAAQREETRHAALWALGCSGRKAAAEECLRWIGDADERTAKLAAEAIGMITGVNARTEGFSVARVPQDEPPPDDEADRHPFEPSLHPWAALPKPSVEAFMNWWSGASVELPDGLRLLRGERWSENLALTMFREGPMRAARSLATVAWFRQGEVRSGLTHGTRAQYNTRRIGSS